MLGPDPKQDEPGADTPIEEPVDDGTTEAEDDEKQEGYRV